MRFFLTGVQALARAGAKNDGRGRRLDHRRWELRARTPPTEHALAGPPAAPPARRGEPAVVANAGISANQVTRRAPNGRPGRRPSLEKRFRRDVLAQPASAGSSCSRASTTSASRPPPRPADHRPAPDRAARPRRARPILIATLTPFAAPSTTPLAESTRTRSTPGSAPSAPSTGRRLRRRRAGPGQPSSRSAPPTTAATSCTRTPRASRRWRGRSSWARFAASSGTAPLGGLCCQPVGGCAGDPRSVMRLAWT